MSEHEITLADGLEAMGFAPLHLEGLPEGVLAFGPRENEPAPSEPVGECGCRLVRVVQGLRIEDCPLHAAAGQMRDLLAAAVARVGLENKEGNPILSAWLPEAEALLAKIRGPSAEGGEHA